jgi:acyl transferase domain-containing protein
MAPMVEEFAAAAGGVELRRPVIPFVSTVTGEREHDAVQDPDYWRRHVADTVRFADAVAALRRLGVTDFLEVGPQPTLLGMVSRLDTGAGLHPSLRSGRPDDEQVAETLVVVAAGLEPDWTRARGGARAGAPTADVSFQRVRHCPGGERGARVEEGRSIRCASAPHAPPSPATFTRRRFHR